MMNRFGEHGWGMGLGVGWWLFIGIIVVLITVLMIIKIVKKERKYISYKNATLDMLKKRYKRNKINKQGFEERKRVIKK